MRTMAAAKRWPVTAVRSTPHRRLVRAAAGVSAHFCVRRVTCRICPAGSSEAELSYQEPWEGGVSSAAAARGSQHDAGASGGSDGGGGVSDGGSSGSVGSLVVNLPPGAASVHERSQAALSGSFLMRVGRPHACVGASVYECVRAQAAAALLPTERYCRLALLPTQLFCQNRRLLGRHNLF